MSLFKTVTTALVAVYLCACSDTKKLPNALETYQQRLANVMEVPGPSPLEVPPLSYPPLAELRHELTQVSISLPEFYALDGCPVNTLIAQRNTALGKVQAISQRYLYEMRLLQGLKDCLTINNDPSMTAQLTQWHTQKSIQQPLLWANLMQSSKEVRSQLSDNNGFVLGDEGDNLAAVQQAWRYLLSLEAATAIEEEELESHLQVLKLSPLLARMHRSSRLISTSLQQTTRWLEQNVANALCTNQVKSQQLSYLNNVFQRFFIEQIQPIAAALNGYHYQLGPTLEAMLTHPNLDAKFKQLLREQQASFADYQKHMAEHVSFWQQLYAKCDLSPGGGR